MPYPLFDWRASYKPTWPRAETPIQRRIMALCSGRTLAEYEAAYDRHNREFAQLFRSERLDRQVEPPYFFMPYQMLTGIAEIFQPTNNLLGITKASRAAMKLLDPKKPGGR